MLANLARGAVKEALDVFYHNHSPSALVKFNVRMPHSSPAHAPMANCML